MNIIFMGTPEFAVPSLRTLVENRFTVSAVVTAPDKPRGRGQHVSFTPVKEYALAQGLPVLQPERLRDPQFAEELRAYNADLFIIVAFRILPAEVFTMPRLGSFNLHASLLPRYRGAAPINWAIINGDTESGVTTFFLREQVDTGSIILQKRCPIGDEMDAGELHDRLMSLGAEAVLETVQRIAIGRAEPSVQDDALATPAPKIFKEMCRIDWTQSARKVHDFIRGLSPHPGAWTMLEGRMMKLFRTRIAAEGAGASGTLRATPEGRLFAGTAQGELEILELQAEGKKRMTAAEFLRGHKLAAPGWDR